MLIHIRASALGWVLALAFGLIAVACKEDEINPSVPAGSSDASTNDVVADQPVGTIHPENLVDIEGDASVSGEIDPCSLVTKAEVEDVLGQKVNEVYRHSALCEYIADEASFGSANIRVETNVSEEERMSSLEVLEQVGQTGAEELPGLGDFAYSIGPTVYIARGSTTLLVLVGKDESPNLDAAKVLASKAFARLPSDL
jgi:hypothetical protein